MIRKNGILELSGMEFHAFHGCLPQERKDGNTFTVDFRGVLDMSTAVASDSLSDALDYSVIYNAVAGEMAVPSDLLEHLAGRIVLAVALACPELESFSITVSKKNPPVAGPVAWSRITLEWKR